MFSLREERDLVVDVLQHDEYRGLAGQLLGSVVLKCFTMQGGVRGKARATDLYTDGEVVLLDPLEVQRLVDLHVGVGPAVLLPLLEVESVVLVGLVCRAADQLVENSWVVLDTGTEMEMLLNAGKNILVNKE